MVAVCPSRRSSAFLYTVIVWIGVLPWVSGCGNSPVDPSGTISGRVTYEGQPVQQGVVTFYSSELGVGISEELQEGGQYKTNTPIPTGSYVVTVLPPEQPPSMEEELVVEISPVKDIPDKYRDPSQSGLKLEVTQGDNSFDIDMTK
ncbi:hypothetical protein Poly24_23560 [Rosistilla carotiformis]|uniref:Carboxypeptidase regulatory-like domain-containing protein n=1 Tax=Rosistilla carotiformis TaxID=2528017 RepID=A0A518JSW9_9BACT|nr:hypothetical protein Poly24_23560 [Rosistilla carotiformis]